MTSSRSGREGRQPALFSSDAVRQRGRKRATSGEPSEEDLMEKDRARRPLFELEPPVQAAKIKASTTAHPTIRRLPRIRMLIILILS